MFYYLKGKVAALEPYLAVIDCSGIGFACNTSMRTLSALKAGQEATLYTYCNIREDAFDIYGFLTPSEIQCFRMLVGVSGVGPKAALSILSANAPEDLAMSIASGNEKALTLAPGVGKKLAQRIILELKDKVVPGSGAGTSFTVTTGDSSVRDEALSALVLLGFAKPAADKALTAVLKSDPTVSLEELIKKALKIL